MGLGSCSIKPFQVDCTDKTLLLVADEPASLQTLESHLEGRGLNLITALDGASAMEKARREHADLILLDSTIAGMSSFETCRQLKADPALQKIPVILIATSQETLGIAKCFEAGSDFIIKPIQQEELLARIGVHLSRRRLRVPSRKVKTRLVPQDTVEARLQALQEQNRQLQDKTTQIQRTLEGCTIAQQALGERDARNRLLLHSTQEGILSLNLEGRCTFCNQSAARLLGYADHRQLLGKDLHALTHYKRRDGSPYPAEECLIRGSYLRGENLHSSDEVFRRADGTSVAVEFHASPLRQQGRLVGAVISFQDISERLQAEQALRLGATVLDASDEAVMFCDVKHQVIRVNPAFNKITGFSDAEVLGTVPTYFLTLGPHELNLYEQIWQAVDATGAWRGEMVSRRKSGETFPCWVNVSQVRDTHDRLTHYVTVFSDISAIKQSHAHMDHLAHHDLLTDLPNRLLLQDRLRQAIAKAKRHRSSFALLFIDLDQFKQVNDTLGHPMGDQLLQEVARRLRLLVRRSDTIARMGGDEFVLLLEEMSKRRDASQIAQKVIDEINRPITVEGHRLHVGASIGISRYPQNGQDADELLRVADIAMYGAKHKNRNSYCFYKSSLRDQKHSLEVNTQVRQDSSETHPPPKGKVDRIRRWSA
jgi:diguanylate cyclase (GGDEF)-like protein/PAS domain S-box-containing protein